MNRQPIDPVTDSNPSRAVMSTFCCRVFAYPESAVIAGMSPGATRITAPASICAVVSASSARRIAVADAGTSTTVNPAYPERMSGVSDG